MSEDNNMNFDDLVIEEFKKDINLLKEILEEEIIEYKETNDITYVLKDLSRYVAILGFPYFEEKTGLNRVIMYGILKRKIDLDMIVVNKMLKAIDFEEI